MTRDALILLAIAGGCGASAFILAWLVSRAVADVPAENRDYKDPPPLGFRLVWRPVQWLSFFLNGWLPERTQTTLAARLRKAGLDYSLNPAQFVAARLVGAVLAGLVGQWMLGSFDRGHLGAGAYLQAWLWAGLLGWLYPVLWLRERLAARRRELLKLLPFFLDLITLCVEAGLNLQGAIHQAVLKGPASVMRDELQRMLRDIRAGKGRADSLRALADRLQEPGITTFATAVIQAESLGLSLGPVLRAQADQRRSERFLRAEKLAMQAPVKMLFPLIAFIFPCTFVVLFFPIVMKFLQAGI